MKAKPFELAQSLLNSTLVDRIRRNHGLEHATLAILSQRHPRTSMAGHSDFRGFRILGEVSQEEVSAAMEEGLRRMRAGERHLAVHPNCGTNFVTSGVLAGSAAALAMFGAGRRLRDKLDRLPVAITLATVALMVAQPLGLLLQEEITTSGEPGALRVVQITSTRHGKIQSHRVITEG